jgi:hypothetical protein
VSIGAATYSHSGTTTLNQPSGRVAKAVIIAANVAFSSARASRPPVAASVTDANGASSAWKRKSLSPNVFPSTLNRAHGSESIYPPAANSRATARW